MAAPHPVPQSAFPVRPLLQALDAWRRVLGAEHVITAPREVQTAATATFATDTEVPAILRPANRAEVQECVRIAGEYSIPLYPYSTGKNWGYGSRVPPGNSVLLDLGRLNRIIDFSEELGYVTVEPGVTQRQLFDFLADRKSKLWMDATGASPECSLLGNAVERGFGHTPYSDHFANFSNLEVVLASGECIETGFGRYGNARAAGTWRYGLGPVLDGLFSQSNFGVVTRATVWLMPAPEYFQAFYFRVEREEDLPGLIDALRPLRMNGTLRSGIHIGNDCKVLSGIRQYPWEEAGERTPLPPEVMEQQRKKLQFGAWNGGGGLYGTRAQVKEARRLVKKALKGRVSRLTFLDERTIRIAEKFARPFQMLTGWDLSRTLELVKPVFGLMRGVPTEAPLASTYWRKRGIVPEKMDPDRDGCGLYWCSPVAPMDGAVTRRLTDRVSSIFQRHGYEPMISLTLINERSIACVISLSYDREIPGEDARAAACHDELVQELQLDGFYPYRLGIRSMAAFRRQDGYARLLENLKNTLDPHGILSPERYLGTVPEPVRAANSVPETEAVRVRQF